jgi:hypothetical protein
MYLHWLCTLVLLYGLQMSPLQTVTSFVCLTFLPRPKNLNESVHTFTDPCTQAHPYARQPSRPLGPVHPNLGVPCLFLFLMVGKDPWRVHAPKVPTFPSSATVGCWINPKFCLLEDLGEGVCILLTEDLRVGLYP